MQIEPRIEHWSPGPLANTQNVMPMDRLNEHILIPKKISKYIFSFDTLLLPSTKIKFKLVVFVLDQLTTKATELILLSLTHE